MSSNRLMARLILVVGITLSLGLLLQTAAFAAGECAGDAATWCQGAAGPQQTLGCLKQNYSQLSEQCQVHLAELAEALKETHQDCEADLFNLCLGVPPGGGQVVQCLKLNENYVSPGCKAALMNLKATQGR